MRSSLMSNMDSNTNQGIKSFEQKSVLGRNRRMVKVESQAGIPSNQNSLNVYKRLHQQAIPKQNTGDTLMDRIH